MSAKKKPFHVVSPDDKVEPRRKVSAKIEDSLDGSARDLLASMRLALARKLDSGEVSSNAVASAYKELREIDRQIRNLDIEVEEADAGAISTDEEWSEEAI